MIKKVQYRMTNGKVKFTGSTTQSDYKYILHNSTEIKCIQGNMYCIYNGFHCKFMF